MSSYTGNTLDAVYSTPVQATPQRDSTYPTPHNEYQYRSPHHNASPSTTPGEGSASASGTGRRTRMTSGKGLEPVCYHASIEDMLEALREEIESNTKEEATTIELCLSEDATIPLLRPLIGPYAEGGEQDLPASIKSTTSSDGVPFATVAIITCAPQPEVRQIQRAASRGLCAAVESLDGFRYTFNNVWSAKDLDGLRFSWICQDSMQNKDRHANGFARTSKVVKQFRGARKATFDCRGSVNVKFSARSGGCIVQYRHRRVHCKVEERLPGGKAVPVGEYDQGALVVGEAGPVARRKWAESAGAEHGFGSFTPTAQVHLVTSVPPARVPSLFELLSETAAEDAAQSPLGSAVSPWWGNT